MVKRLSTDQPPLFPLQYFIATASGSHYWHSLYTEGECRDKLEISRQFDRCACTLDTETRGCIAA